MGSFCMMKKRIVNVIDTPESLWFVEWDLYGMWSYRFVYIISDAVEGFTDHALRHTI